jgi:glycosyltransferase involved in cell wall biosynthesis
MNILMVSDVYLPRVNGVSTSIHTFRQALLDAGDRVALVCPDYAGAGGEPDVWRVPGWQVPRDPEDRLMNPRRLAAVLGELGREAWDAVHVQTPFVAHYAGLALARRIARPCVATYHTLFEEYLHHYVPLAPRRVTAALARRFSRSQCNALDALIVPSRPMRDTLSGYGVRAPMRVLPTGVPPEALAGGDGAAFRRRIGIRPGQPVLLFVGRVAGEKNIGFLLRALAVVRQRLPEAVLVVAGEGPALPELTRLAQRLGLAAAVRFVGYLARDGELQGCYRAADLFVFASRTETQGLVLLEAMALSVPVVALAVMGTRDILDPGQGCVVAADHPESFAAEVIALLQDPQRRACLAKQAAAYARSWSAAALGERLREFYREVASAGGPAPGALAGSVSV